MGRQVAASGAHDEVWAAAKEILRLADAGVPYGQIGLVARTLDPYLNLNNSGASNLTLGSNELAEATVVVNGYTGQYGRQAGANVNYVTKSGTNEFHGAVDEFARNRVLNSVNYFALTTPPFIQNQFGGTIGCPSIVPRTSAPG